MFQSTPPCGGRRSTGPAYSDSRSFNPRPRAGGDLPPAPVLSVRPCFNPRPRAGGDHVRGLRHTNRRVSIHAPVRGATGAKYTTAGNPAFQSTPPCGGRRYSYGGTAVLLVSIHAPVRGATSAPRSLPPIRRFQSTPPCGGRPSGRAGRAKSRRFQSTPPCGGRPPEGIELVEAYPVSIHAPVRGATWSSGKSSSALTSFNPRPRAGGDGLSGLLGGRPRPFQSTPPCGGRRRQCRDRLLVDDVSIHAPVRGATRGAADGGRDRGGFNPRPRAGGDTPR